MHYSQSFYPQGIYPQTFYPEGNFNPPQAGFYPHGTFNPLIGAVPAPFPSVPSNFANTLYGLPQNTLYGPPQQAAPPPAQVLSSLPNWQHLAHQQQALQQLIQQLVAQQLAAPLGTPNLTGSGILSNGAGAQTAGAWPQQPNPGKISPTQQQWTQQQWTQPPLLQQLAQHHQAITQQLLQLAGQQAFQGAGNPYAGQFMTSAGGSFIPAAIGGGFVPGITMH
jgi:hypothetical protein